ncbi:MAG: LiaF-related protein [Eubacteriales bacterium]|nr:LiaF-related protein [Eubacteriales bacterium]
MKTSSRIFWGLILIAVAAYLIVFQLGLISIELNVGTIIMAILCLAIFVGSLCDRSFGGVFFSLGLAWVSLGKLFGLPTISPWLALLIVVILTAGFHLLFPNAKVNKKTHNHNKHHNHEKWDDYADEHKIGEHQKVSESEEDGFVFCTNTFGQIAKYINTNNFKGANLSNTFGELKVYFDNALIVDSPIEIQVSNSFGSMQLFVPKDWNVVHDIHVFAGDAREQNHNNASTTPVVNISGNVNFGEIQIIYI